jgi:exopolysaccharide biosynthesis polyprenyl glycosylphosphotransferase
MKSNASLIYNFFLVVGDFLALVAAFAAAFIIRGKLYSAPVAHPIPSHTYIDLFVLLLPFWILIFAVLGLYNNSIVEKRFQEMGRLLIGSFVGLLFVISYGYAVNRIIFPARLVPVYAFVLAFVFLVIIRNTVRAIRIMLFSYDIGITNLLIVGNTKVAQELVSDLSNRKVSGYRIVGVVGNKSHAKEKYPHIPVYENFEEAVKKIHSSDIHSIVQTELFASTEINNHILEFAQTHHISFRFVPGNSELFVGNIAVELFRSSIPVIAVHQTALIGWGRIVKRLSDIILSLILLVPGLPLMLVIGLLMKLFDPRGPVIYKDARLTRFGNIIKVYKFRSLKKNYNGLQPEQAFAKMNRPDLARLYRANGDYLVNDPRISRIGRLLRRTSLDEFPQLINILRGDISFVGPRALHSIELEQYAKKDLILAVKSGLTGLAQVSGRRDISVEERRKLDLYYVQNWSIWLDLVIIVKTVRVVFGRGGAK